MFQTALTIIFAVFALLFGIWLALKLNGKVDFFAKGHDLKFTMSEISMLWKLSQITDLEEPCALFVSENALSKCIAKFAQNAKVTDSLENVKNQNFLMKLYKFREKLRLESQNKKIGLESTRRLENGQKLRLILKGFGIFSSKIADVGKELAILVPIQDGYAKLKGKDWEGKEVSVYLWRKNDAAYVFDTRVLRSGIFLGNSVLFLQHSENLLRTQKRNSIRTQCKFPAQMYFIKEKKIDYSKIERSPGYKCLVEDISADGALIRIGGKGINGAQIKIQFEIDGALVVMYAIVRSVEYNAQTNQSHLHVQCNHIDDEMKNSILNFVYKDKSEEQKAENDALAELKREVLCGEDLSIFENKQQKKEEPHKIPLALDLKIPIAIDPTILANEDVEF